MNDLTTAVSLVLANDEPLYQRCCEIARTNRPLSDSAQDWVENTARDLEEIFTSQRPDIAEPYNELLMAALDEVDWDNIAVDFCDDWDEDWSNVSGEFDDANEDDDIL